MSITYVLRKFIVYADGVGKLGEGEDAKLPVMEVHTEDFRGGGMDQPIKVDLGATPLVLEFKLSSFDPQVYSLWGLFPGQEKQFTVRGSLADQTGNAYAAICSCQGNLQKSDADNFAPGKKVIHSFMCNLSYYKLVIGETLIYEMDVINCKRIVGGIDQLTTDRQNLGLVV
jgi:Bacteriophage tail tube protein